MERNVCLKLGNDMSRPLNANAALCEKPLPESPLHTRNRSARRPAPICHLPSAILVAGVAALLFMTSSLQAGPRDAQWKQVEDSHQEGPAQDRHHQPRAHHPGRAQGQGLRRGGEGHRREDRAGRQHPGQQAGGEDHAPGGRDREGAEGNGAADGYPAGRMVLAVLPAEPVALHAAHRHRPPSRARTSPPGTCPACLRRLTSSSRRPSRRRRFSKPRPSAPGMTCCKRAPCRTVTGPRSTISSPTRRCSSTPPASRRRPNRKMPSSCPRTARVLDSAEKFMGWQPAAGADTDSPVLKAIRLYQDLLRFHKSDPAPRLAFAARRPGAARPGAGTRPSARTRTPVTRRRWKRSSAPMPTSTSPRWPSSARRGCSSRKATWSAARKLALRGAELFPQSPGGKLCRNLVTEIEAKSASITTERVWNCFPASGAGVSPASEPGKDSRDACPTFTVRYRNVEAVYFRAIPVRLGDVPGQAP